MKSRFLIVLVILFSLKTISQELDYIDYREFVLTNYNFEEFYSSKRNLFLKDNIVHIFIDENGNLIETGLPTTATEKYSYKLHLITSTEILDEGTTFKYSYRGEFKPTFNVQNENLNETNNEEQPDSDEEYEKPKIVEFSYAIIGPFTDDFNITVKRIDLDENDDENETVILDKKINVAKTFHVSISTGLFMTTLSNPLNIKTSQNSNGETTLIADDQGVRGLISLNAVFYPKGRSFLFPPSDGFFSPERFGVLIGTQLDKDQFENFIGGIQYDFARGGSITIGAHFGRRNVIAGYDNFKFGEDIFEGNIDNDIVKEWNVGFVFGANLDVRIFGQLFNPTK